MIDTLAPLRARYAQWLSLDADEVLTDREEAAEDVRALQVVLRMERDRPPGWHAAIGLAATAVAALCLDPRTAAGGAWHDAVAAYSQGHIRKVTRRARGAQWEAVQDLPGITLSSVRQTTGSGGTEVRALLPGRVSTLDKRVARLQVGGTDAPYDEPVTTPDGPLLRMWLPTGPAMSLGKSMAQTGHAAMIAVALLAGDAATVPDLQQWADVGYPAVGTRADAETWSSLSQRLATPDRAWHDDRLLAVRDAGFTEIAPGTITVIAEAPRGNR